MGHARDASPMGSRSVSSEDVDLYDGEDRADQVRDLPLELAADFEEIELAVEAPTVDETDIVEECEVGKFADGHVGVTAWTAEELADVSFTDEEGYVICSAPQLASLSRYSIGRVTDCPELAEESKQNISCSCFLPGGCKSPASTKKDMRGRLLLV